VDKYFIEGGITKADKVPSQTNSNVGKLSGDQEIIKAENEKALLINAKASI
jgi:hypothetical protein